MSCPPTSRLPARLVFFAESISDVRACPRIFNNPGASSSNFMILKKRFSERLFFCQKKQGAPPEPKFQECAHMWNDAQVS